MSNTLPPATAVEVTTQLIRVRDGLRSKRDSAPDSTRTDYDCGQIDGAVTGLNLALQLLGQLPEVELGDASQTDEATILPFERP